MKTKKSIYLPLFFSFCILASIVAGLFQNLNTPVRKSNFIFSKNVSYTDKEQKSTSNDFLFEENETEDETESSLDFKLRTNSLADLVSYFQTEKDQVSYGSNILAENHASPIYLLVCDFRI